MLPTEQPAFFALVSGVFGDYLKQPTTFELEAWWNGCRTFALSDVERALKAHQQDAKDGKHPPRPMDVKRHLSVATSDSATCAATDMAAGRCQYPGIFSDTTSGEGRWFCPWHRMEQVGPEAARWIEISHQIPYAEARAKRIDRMAAESLRAPGAVATSHAIALRHGNKPWQPATRMQWPGGLSPDEETLVPRQPGEDAEAA
jgi:hypothetical protein